jgi:hypothetical protein
MPSSPDYKRDYKQEAKTADARGERPKNIERKRARRLAVRLGLVKPHDGKDVDHAVPLSEGGAKSNGKSTANLDIESAHKNRSYARNPDGSMKNRSVGK